MTDKSISIPNPLTLTFNLILNIKEIPFKLRDDIATFFNNHQKSSSPVVSSETGITSSVKTGLTDGDVKLKVGVDTPIIQGKNDSPDKSHPSVNLALSIPPTPYIDDNHEAFGISGDFFHKETTTQPPTKNNTNSNKTPSQEKDAEIKLQLVIPSPVTDNQEKNKNEDEDVNNVTPIVQDESNKNKISLNVQINSQKSTGNDNNNTTSTSANPEEITAVFEDPQEHNQYTNSDNGETDTSSKNNLIFERHDSKNSDSKRDSVFDFETTSNKTDNPVVAPVLKTSDIAEFKHDENSIVSKASSTENSMITPLQQFNDDDKSSILTRNKFFNSSSSNLEHYDNDSIETNYPESLSTSSSHDEDADNSSLGLDASAKSVSVKSNALSSTVQRATAPNANTDEVSPINHIGLRGTIYFYVNQDSPTPQLVSGDINHYFDVKDTNITCETNFPIQITHKIDGNSTTSPFNANVTINGNLCIHGHIYNITDGHQITVGNITHIPPRPDTTFTIRDTDKQFVHKYFEYSGKIYVDDWNSKIHWHTYYNPENYKVSSFDSTKEKDTLGVFNIGNWALYKRKINMYIGEVTVMGNIHISPPPFNIDLKKNNVVGGNVSITQDSKVASAPPSVSDSRRSSLSSISTPRNLKSHPLKSRELSNIEKKYKEWKKESGDVARYPYRAYYNNKEKSMKSDGILTEDLIDCILFYRSLENNIDLQNEFIDNIHHFLDAVFLVKINPLVQTILDVQTIKENTNAPAEIIQENAKAPAEGILKDLIEFGESFENEKNKTDEYTLLLQSNPPDSRKLIASDLRLPYKTRVRAARRELLNKAVKLLLEQNESKDSSIISDNTRKKKQANSKKNASNDYQYKIIISGTLHTLVGEGKIHHTFYLVESPHRTNGEETYTHTLTKIKRDKTDAFSKYIDAKFHISGSWVFDPKKGEPEVPDFPKKVDFGDHNIVLPFMYKKPTGQNEQTASIEFKRIHIYKIVGNKDKSLISGSIDLFDAAPQSTPKQNFIHFAPLVYNFNSKMKINVKNEGIDLYKFDGYVVDKTKETHRIYSKNTVTRKVDRPSTAPTSRNSGGRRTRRFRKNLRT